MMVPTRRRRSAADSLADLTPALPPTPVSTGAAGTVALRSEGTTPARRDDGDAEADGPGVAALGLAATLAIALAALRGTATALTDWRQRHQERAEELAPLREARLKHQLAGEEAAAKHSLAMQGISDKAAQKRGKSIPSSQDFGRKSLGGGRGSLMGGGGKGSGPGGKGAGGTGPGRSGKGGPGSGLTPSSKKTSPKTSNGLGSVGTKGKGGSKSPGSGSGKNGSSGKNGGSGSGIKSPSDGKSPSSKKSSPAMERARGRQERAATRQGAKIQRRADRQAARAENRAKDRDAARDRKTRGADARQDTKDRVRNARADAKQARKEQVRQDRFEAKQKARKARAKARRKKKETAAAADADRTTLWQATKKEARRRLKKRRKNLAPPVLTTVKRKKSKKKGGKSGGTAPAGPKVDLTKKPKPKPGTAPKVDLTKKPKPAAGSATDTGPKVDLTKKPKPAGGSATGTGPKVDLTKKPKPKPGDTKGSGPGRKKKVRVKSKRRRGSATGTGPADRRKASRKERARRASERARTKTEDTADSAGSGWEFYTPPPRGERRSAYDSMRDTDPQQQEVWKAEQVFPPGYQASPREPLTTGARGLPAGNGSPTTTTKEAPVGNSPAVQTGAVTTAMDDGINPEHATEVTLDDVVDFLDEVVSEAFAAHDECLQLAAKAKELMYALDEVAARLAAKHNIIGTVTAWAMRKLAESMEVLSRKAEEMSTKSLHAAETCETAKTELDDAYRPLTQATADAGLRTPSARVHNEN
ncbi:hypothetical protein [Streptomyces sp. DH41]|uniref:hypothetical protein n=1 Tax=Streptomyces sp. DH41 TaxID=3040125 RepID=UPI00244268C5|nr:hypothetical protein [Streptomyces sp. DH41]MDG9728362.1 hypothetical protein [Streptomyces sp. DH41]